MAKARTDGMHTHKCQNPKGCPAVWEHGNNCSKMFGGVETEKGKEFFYAAHTCPQCGYCELDPVGYHAVDVKANVAHPVQCPVGPHPRERRMEAGLDLLLALLALAEMEDGHEALQKR